MTFNKYVFDDRL